MPVHNYQVIKLVTDRYSAHVKRFNWIDAVTEEDSDAQFALYKELQGMAETAFARAPLFKPSGNRVGLLPAADLGNAYRALKAALTETERARYDEIQEALYAITDKYED